MNRIAAHHPMVMPPIKMTGAIKAITAENLK